MLDTIMVMIPKMLIAMRSSMSVNARVFLSSFVSGEERGEPSSGFCDKAHLPAFCFTFFTR